MAARVQLDYDGMGEVMRLDEVRSALAARAEGIAGRARSLAASEHVTSTIGTESGTRPRGRSFARVVSDNAVAEFGSAKTPRRRLLWRATQ